MEELYRCVGITRQAHQKWRVYQVLERKYEEMACSKCGMIRKNHKRMSSRKIYSMSSSELPFGRDKFERYAHRNGYIVRRKRSFKKTTYPLKEGVVPNLIEGMVVNGPNQVYQSDIFYMKVGNQTMYGFVVIDIYTKELLVLHEANNMSAEELNKAVNKLISKIGSSKVRGAIFHSDRGSQYGDAHFIELCNDNGLRRSMGKRSQQNAYAERVQGTIQYEYLFEMDIEEPNLHRKLAKIARLYNEERPHNSLGGMTPVCFKQQMSKIKPINRPEMQVYQWTEPILTKDMLFNKKEKSSKKEKTLKQHQLV
jgi:putative transposase